MSNNRRGPNPSDVTGRQREAAQKAYAAEQQEAANRMTMITATKARDEANTVTDLTGAGPVDLQVDQLSAEDRSEIIYVDDDIDDDVIESARVEGPVVDTAMTVEPVGDNLSEVVTVRPVRVKSTTRIIRVNSDLDSVTVGYGNTYSFQEGRKYKVPAEVADHLTGLGYVS